MRSCVRGRYVYLPDPTYIHAHSRPGPLANDKLHKTRAGLKPSMEQRRFALFPPTYRPIRSNAAIIFANMMPPPPPTLPSPPLPRFPESPTSRFVDSRIRGFRWCLRTIGVTLDFASGEDFEEIEVYYKLNWKILDNNQEWMERERERGDLFYLWWTDVLIVENISFFYLYSLFGDEIFLNDRSLRIAKGVTLTGDQI